MSHTRFALFTDEELQALWEGLTMDDGISYGIERDDPIYPLAAELHAEAESRGIADGSEWHHVL